MTENDEGMKGRKTGAIAVIVIVLVAIIVGAGLYIHFRPSSASSSGPTVITVTMPIYTSSNSAIETYLNQSMSGWLKAHPNVEVKYVGPFGASTEGQYYTKLDLMTSSKSTAPDVMLEDMFYTATYANAGTLLPLNNYINSSVFNNLYQSGLGQMTIQGTHYGLPMQLSDTLLYYNMSLFNEAGIHTPWQPKNWTDIIHAAQLLKDKFGSSVIPLNVYSGVKADEASAFTGFESLSYGTGYGLYNFTANKWYGTNPGLASTLSFYQKIFVNDSLASTSLSNTPYVTVGQYLQQGKLGIAVDGSWMYGYQWANGSQHPINNFSKYIGVAAIPTEYGQGQGYTTMVGGWGWAAYSGVSNKTLVASFMTALDNTSNEILASLPGSAEPGGLPAAKNAASNPMFSKLLPADPSLNTYYFNLLKYGHYRPPVAGYPKDSYQLQVAMDAVTNNGTSVATALSQYNSALQTTFGSGNVQSSVGSSVTTNNVYTPPVFSVNNQLTEQQFQVQQYYTVVSTADTAQSVVTKFL